jgi:hypothetical protein
LGRFLVWNDASAMGASCAVSYAFLYLRLVKMVDLMRIFNPGYSGMTTSLMMHSVWLMAYW